MPTPKYYTGLSGQRPTVRLDPESRPIIAPGPWYRKLFGGEDRNETKWTLTFLTMFIVGLFIANAIRKPDTALTNAGANNATVSMYPVKAFIPSQNTYQLWVTTGSSVQTASFVVSFDPLVLAISKPVVLKQISSYTISSSSYMEANTSGMLTISLNPVTLNTPVFTKGTYHIATLTVRSLPGTKGKTTIITTSPLTTLTSLSSQPFSLSQIGAEITIQ